jgi:hypothetical protein
MLKDQLLLNVVWLAGGQRCRNGNCPARINQFRAVQRRSDRSHRRDYQRNQQ